MPQNLLEIYDGRTSFWQWDTGQKLIVSDRTIDQVHFSNASMNTAIVKEVYIENGMRLCDVPDMMLKMPKPLVAYAYVIGDGYNKTMCATRFSVSTRPIPEDYTYEENNRFKDLVDKIDAVQDILESGASVKKMNSMVEAEAWAQEYQATGTILSVWNGYEWALYMVERDYSLYQIGDTDQIIIDVENLQNLVGETAVEEQIRLAILALNLANTYEPLGAANVVRNELLDEVQRAKNEEAAITRELHKIYDNISNLETDVNASIKNIADDYLKEDDRVDLERKIKSNADAIELLTNGVSADKIDGVNDLIQYVDEHGAEVTGIKADVKYNADAIAAEKTRAEQAEKALGERLKLIETTGLPSDVDGFVSYNAQNLTEDQKAQARANIGAAQAPEVNKTFVVDNALPFKLTLSELGIYGKVLTGGTANFADIEVIDDTSFLYQINTICFNDCDNVVLEFSDGSTDDSITVIPATTLYYDNSFMNLTSYTVTNVLDANGKVISTSSVQDDGPIGDWKIDDNNTAKITVDDNKRGEAAFTFYGTGFDVISTSNNNTGNLIVQVKNVATGKNVKTLTVDTYYNIENSGDFDSDTLRQVPVMRVSGLPYAQYSVRIIAGYNKSMDRNYDKNDPSTIGYDLYLHAIRIYDSVSNENETALEAYVADREAYPIYRQCVQSIVSANNFNNLADDAIVDKLVLVNNDGRVLDYNMNDSGLMLFPGQAIAFSLDIPENIVALQLGLKSAFDINTEYKIFNAESIDFRNDLNKIKNRTVETCTDMYYDITEYRDGLVVVYNDSKNGAVLMLTTLKMTFGSEQEDTSIKFNTSKSAVRKLLDSLCNEIASTKFIVVSTDDEIIDMLIEEDVLMTVVDADGAILSDDDNNILLW